MGDREKENRERKMNERFEELQWKRLALQSDTKAQEKEILKEMAALQKDIVHQW